MPAIGVSHLQVLGFAVELIHLSCRLCDFIDAAPFEVAVAKRRADEADPRRQGADHLVEVERNFGQTLGILLQVRHVALLSPAFDVPVLVIKIGIQSTA